MLIDENGNYELVYPIVNYVKGSLFVNEDELTLCDNMENIKVNKLKITKTLVKRKINHN